MKEKDDIDYNFINHINHGFGQEEKQKMGKQVSTFGPNQNTVVNISQLEAYDAEKAREGESERIEEVADEGYGNEACSISDEETQSNKKGEKNDSQHRVSVVTIGSPEANVCINDEVTAAIDAIEDNDDTVHLIRFKERRFSIVPIL